VISANQAECRVVVDVSKVARPIGAWGLARYPDQEMLDVHVTPPVPEFGDHRRTRQVGQLAEPPSGIGIERPCPQPHLDGVQDLGHIGVAGQEVLKLSACAFPRLRLDACVHPRYPTSDLVDPRPDLPVRDLRQVPRCRIAGQPGPACLGTHRFDPLPGIDCEVRLLQGLSETSVDGAYQLGIAQ